MPIAKFFLYLALFDFCFGGYVIAKNFKYRKNISFGILCFGMGLWVLGFYLLLTTRTFYWPDKIIDFGGIVIAGALYFFTKVFPSDLDNINAPPGALKSRIKIFLELSALLVLLLILPFNLIIKGARFEALIPTPVNGPLIGVYTLTLSVYVILALRNFYQQFLGSAGYKRQQILYALLGLGAFLAGAVVFDLILPTFGLKSARLLGPIASVLFMLPAAASIVSYRLMDIRIFAGKLFANILAAAASSIFVFWILTKINEDRRDIEVIIPIAVLAIFITTRFLIQKFQQKYFFKGYYQFEESVELLNENLSSDPGLKNLIKIINIGFYQALGLQWVCYFDIDAWKISAVPNQHTDLAARYLSLAGLHQFALQLRQPYFIDNSDFQIERQRPTAIFPVLEKDRPVGYFLLGPQNSSSGLSAEQIKKMLSSWQHIQTAYARTVLRQNLEKRVRDQVENITEKNRRLREEIQGRLDFVRATTHQLRTPVTALSGALQLLAKESDDRLRKELIDLAYEKSKQLSGVISGILNLAKVEQGNIRSTQEILSLSKLFSNVLAVINPLAALKNISIGHQISEDLQIFGSRQYLEQAFANILENAVQFSPAGAAIKIYLMLEPEFAIICIADSGPGIPEELRSKIFHKNLHSPNSAGLGLGLYLAKSIIAAHPKGHIWFESGGAGTTFFVRLKRAKTG